MFLFGRGAGQNEMCIIYARMFTQVLDIFDSCAPVASCAQEAASCAQEAASCSLAHARMILC